MTYDYTQVGETTGTDMESGRTYTYANVSDKTYAGMGNTGGGTGWVCGVNCSETIGMASTHYGQHYEITGTVTETAGYNAIASAHISEHDFQMQGGLQAGTAVGVGYKAGVHGMGVHLQTADGVSIGPQLAVNGSLSFSYKDNKITFAAAGKIAAEIGVHGSFKIVIDTKTLDKDVKVVENNVVKSYKLIGNEFVQDGIVSQTTLEEITGEAQHQIKDVSGDATIVAHTAEHQESALGRDVDSVGHAVTKVWGDITHL